MQWLADLFIGAIRWILDLVVAIFKLIGTVLLDVLCFVIDSCGDFVVFALNQFNFAFMTSWAQTAWNALPLQLLDMAVSVGLNQCLTIIMTAVLLRLALQLVPFTRLGS